MALKLKYTVSMKTELPAYDIFEHIKTRLYVNKYRIISITEDTIGFRNQLAFGWNFGSYRLDGGEFLVIDNETDERLVTLNYYVNMFPSLLVLVLLIIGLISNKAYGGIIFFAVFLVVAMMIENMRAIITAKDFVSDILKIEN